MRKAWVAAVVAVGLLAGPAAAQDAKTIVSNASKAMGVDGLNSIHYYGVAQNGNLGQNNNANQPWPMTAANDYVRAIDFTQPASRATWQTYAVPVTGGAAALAARRSRAITAQNTPWAQQLEIWITPWGFLKGAAANNATVQIADARRQALPGGHLQRAGEVAGRPAVPGRRLHQRDRTWSSKVQTWLDNAFFGDMLIEADYLYYRDNNGLKFPARIVQRRARLADVRDVRAWVRTPIPRTCSS